MNNELWNYYHILANRRSSIVSAGFLAFVESLHTFHSRAAFLCMTNGDANDAAPDNAWIKLGEIALVSDTLRTSPRL